MSPLYTITKFLSEFILWTVVFTDRMTHMLANVTKIITSVVEI